MPPIRRLNKFRRNDPCPCGSSRKFKKCCGGVYDARAGEGYRGVSYIDTGETAVRWVICDERGTSFFSDKDNRMLVFTDKPTAIAVANMTEFSEQHTGEINVAGIGATKFTYLCETMPYVEVTDIETAVNLVRERIDAKLAELETKETE